MQIEYVCYSNHQILLDIQAVSGRLILLVFLQLNIAGFSGHSTSSTILLAFYYRENIRNNFFSLDIISHNFAYSKFAVKLHFFLNTAKCFHKIMELRCLIPNIF